ncbi:glycosyltransferase [Cyanobacterium aponinum FACHB-4101]|uniref:glycosyltransferase family 4 protein n=1 Tax=Cyanobacterium aponinum TaxID=379064 RepID=UPI0016812946|nr:glycosyltransferase family 4 protein [Cyanobacterium aponinum]MBD2393579.1 glycosyltransferase [Cyanobacterium aponinum FACHB-4101]
MSERRKTILFIHPNFPAQFRHLGQLLGKNPLYDVFFLTKKKEGAIEGITKIIYQPSREAKPETHHYVRPIENAVLQGQAVYRALINLKQKGFYPDIIYGHSGWGSTLFVKDIFPRALFLAYFEWFYHAIGTDADFDPNEPLTADDQARIRVKNTPILIDLYSCDRGLSPTQWQKQQFPREYHNKITVLHDGVDTDYFQPNADTKLVIPSLNLDLSDKAEIITYVARGMEPYRGFPQLIETIYILQKRRPQSHFVIVGQNRVAYGKQLPEGQNYQDLMLAKFPLDLTKVSFTGLLPYSEYLKVLQASSAHIYLTRPFVLSWSMLEAMATGCVVIASDTQPVKEIIVDNYNGLLVPFFEPEKIADKVEYALSNRDLMAKIRKKARQTIVENYKLSNLIQKHINWIETGKLTSSTSKKKKTRGF